MEEKDDDILKELDDDDALVNPARELLNNEKGDL
jgi:hypothetical protein